MEKNNTVILGRDMQLFRMVTYNPGYLVMFRHFDILLPLHDHTVQSICAARGITTELFLTIASVYGGRTQALTGKPGRGDLPVLLAYLKRSHRYYQEEIYPDVAGRIAELNKKARSPEMQLVDRFFSEYYGEVKEHLDYEDTRVFPYVEALLNQPDDGGSSTDHEEFKVEEYKGHHSDIEQKLDDLINLLLKYVPGDEFQKQRRELYLLLVQLDYDLKAHSRIEDLIFIPLVESLEKKR